MSIVKQSLVGASGQGGGYTIDDSLRFRSSASAYLTRTFPSAGNRRTWTWSGWVKRGKLGTNQLIFGSTPSGASGPSNYNFISWTTEDKIDLSGYSAAWRRTNAVYRDPSAWYHIVLAYDTTQATASNRIKMYVNGEEVTSFQYSVDPSLNQELGVNQAAIHTIGSRQTFANDYYLDGYITEVNFIDGQQLTADDFGEYDDNGTWKAKQYTGTYGTNGFYLPFRNPTAGTVSADYLVVAGGGGGTYANAGGGGEVIESTSQTLSLNTSYAVTIGAGGAGGNPGADGSNSVFATDTANSGKTPTSAYGAAGTSGNGTLGGTGRNVGSPPFLGGGGGGDGQVGANASGSAAGAGGNGTSSSITGTPVLYGAGGGGGAEGSGTRGLGGNTGGGNGTGVLGSPAGSAGAASTGGGGGGGDGGNTTLGYAGGSGVVIISYAGAQQFNGGTITSSGGNTIHTFTTSDILTPVFNDDSGNDNNWTGNNFNVSDSTATTYDLMKDTPSLVDENAGNFCTLSPISKHASSSTTNGNLTGTTTTASDQMILSTFAVSSGKWYWEVVSSAQTAAGCMVGIRASYLGFVGSLLSQTDGYAYYPNGSKYSGAGGASYGASWTNGDVIGIALDLDNGTIVFYKNNVSQGTAFTGINGTYTPGVSNGGATSSSTFDINFGQRPFAYTPPTGFKKLNTFNLPDSTIEDGSQYFQTVLRNGFGGTGGTVATNFQADLIWEKTRNIASGHFLIDSVRGIASGTAPYLSSNLTQAEANATWYEAPTASTIGFNSNDYGSSTTLVDWIWKANGSGVSNTDGNVNSTVSANTTAGFSIVSWQFNSSFNNTVGHGLGVAPSMMIIKSRTTAYNWDVYHIGLSNPATKRILLNTTGAEINGFFVTNPTSTIFTYASNALSNNDNAIAYCFAEVPGYSAFGSYTGNGSADGPFVYTGFRPAWILYKRSSAAGDNWRTIDTSRDPYNVSGNELYPNLANAEVASGTNTNYVDILSNGFKVRNPNQNASGSTYIYTAFAENPFKNANAR